MPQLWPTFFCETCHDWTEMAHDSGRSHPYCDTCGDDYLCGECGELIYNDGTCSRRTCLQGRG